MSKLGRRWFVRLSVAAEQDFRNIIEWTSAQFGASQALTYAAAISQAFEALSVGPDVAGARTRDEISPGLLSVQVKLGRRRGSHLVFFRASASDREVMVTRILHTAMNAKRHLKNDPKM